MNEPRPQSEDLGSPRPHHLVPADPAEPAISPRDFLQKTLKLVKRRRGLIHGTYSDGGRVCALGAFGACNDGIVIPGRIAFELQRYNDSMPEVTPETRRAKVIAWIEQRLKEFK